MLRPLQASFIKCTLQPRWKRRKKLWLQIFDKKYFSNWARAPSVKQKSAQIRFEDTAWTDFYIDRYNLTKQPFSSICLNLWVWDAAPHLYVSKTIKEHGSKLRGEKKRKSNGNVVFGKNHPFVHKDCNWGNLLYIAD